MNKDLLIIYKNYLYALQWIKEFENRYNDKDIVKVYENGLIKILKK